MRKAERSDYDTKGCAGLPSVFYLSFPFFFLFSLAAVGSGGCSGEAKTCRVSTLAKSTAN